MDLTLESEGRLSTVQGEALHSRSFIGDRDSTVSSESDSHVLECMPLRLEELPPSLFFLLRGTSWKRGTAFSVPAWAALDFGLMGQGSSLGPLRGRLT